MEKRLRNDAADIYVDGDEESQQSSTDSNKLSAPQPDPSFESIISMEDEEFASDDEKVRWREHTVEYLWTLDFTVHQQCHYP